MTSTFNLYKKYSFFLITFLFVQVVFGQFTIPEKPKLQTSVYDDANLLSKEQKAALENKLIKYSDSTSTQIVVVTVETIKGENIDILAANWGHKWGIGQAKEDNGILILLALEERKIAIQVGYGIEHLLTDAFSKRIIENIIIPEFKKGDYYAGLDKGVQVVFEVLNGSYQGERESDNQNSGIPPIFIILIIFFVLLIIFSKKNKGGNNGGNRRDSTATDILTAILLSRAGRGSFGGGSFGGGSSGGFGGGFGGGGFGGGGASGGW